MIKIKALIYYVLNFIIIFILSQSGAAKYILLLASAVFLFIVMKDKLAKSKILVFFLPWFYYIIWGFGVCVIHQNFTNSTIKQALFYVTPIVVSLCFYLYFQNDVMLFINTQFVATVTYFLLWGVKNYSPIDKMESQFAFVFGIFFLFYFYRKNWIMVLLCLPIVYLANKRIAMVGMICCCAYICGLKLFRSDRVKRNLVNLVTLLVVPGCFFYIYIIESGWLNKVLSLYKINSMGRMNVYSLMGQYYEFNPWFAGTGIGTVESLVKQLGFPTYQLLHNDLLSMYIELGFVGFFVFICLFVWGIRPIMKERNCKDYMLISAIYLYTIILFATDNVSIYISYFYPFYLIIFSLCMNRGEVSDGKKRQHYA